MEENRRYAVRLTGIDAVQNQVIVTQELGMYRHVSEALAGVAEMFQNIGTIQTLYRSGPFAVYIVEGQPGAVFITEILKVSIQTPGIQGEDGEDWE